MKDYKNLMKAKYYHTVIEEMEKAKEQEEMYGESYARNRMGQYTSRDMEPMYSNHYHPQWYPRSYGMMPYDAGWDSRGRNW